MIVSEAVSGSRLASDAFHDAEVALAARELDGTRRRGLFSQLGFLGANATLNSNSVGVHDMQILMVGTKINF